MVVLVAAVGCGGPGAGPTTLTAAPPVSMPPMSMTVPEALDTGDLDSPEVRMITVDDDSYLVAFVDEPSTRARGLMGVEDLGDLDGMLFDLGSERSATFTMRNTLIPLDIVFFAADGSGRVMLTMEPCAAEPCPTYPSVHPVRYALEVPAGSTALAADSVLVVP